MPKEEEVRMMERLKQILPNACAKGESETDTASEGKENEYPQYPIE